MHTLTEYQLGFAEELASSGIRFLVVGGRALEAHGIPRDTHDLDVLVPRSGDDPERLFPLITKRIDAISPRLSPEALRLPRKLIALPSPENKEVDILTSIGALDFDLAEKACLRVPVGDVMLPVLGLSELIYSKLVSAAKNEAPQAKARDLEDLRSLLALWYERHNLSLNADARGQAARTG